MKTVKMKLVMLVMALGFFTMGEMKAQCSDPNETQVRNISEAADFVTFLNQTPIYNGGELTGYAYSAGASKGHRRSGGCCQFNGGWCGKFSLCDLETDLEGNITSADFQMYLGRGEDGTTYLKFVGIEEYE